MDKQTILAMQPGKELDALVAIQVMGWSELWTDGKNYMAYPPHEQSLPVGESERNPVWPYSTDIAAAWEVTEKMSIPFKIEKSYEEKWEEGPIGYAVNWCDNGYCNEGYCDNWDACAELKEVWAKTAPEAICKAALLAETEHK